MADKKESLSSRVAKMVATRRAAHLARKRERFLENLKAALLNDRNGDVTYWRKALDDLGKK